MAQYKVSKKLIDQFAMTVAEQISWIHQGFIISELVARILSNEQEKNHFYIFFVYLDLIFFRSSPIYVHTVVKPSTIVGTWKIMSKDCIWVRKSKKLLFKPINLWKFYNGTLWQRFIGLKSSCFDFLAQMQSFNVIFHVPTIVEGFNQSVDINRAWPKKK